MVGGFSQDAQGIGETLKVLFPEIADNNVYTTNGSPRSTANMRLHQYPLLLTWFNFNLSMDK